MNSAIYHGWLDHRRLAPRPHAFRYRLFMLYLDLTELDSVFRGRWLLSTRRPALARFDRGDHLGDPAQPLDDAVRCLVAAQTGRRPEGPVRLLTHLRYFGYIFNPVSFYYCFDRTGKDVETIVAEITNTPWKERHAYVLPVTAANRTSEHLHFAFAKDFHVSPFWPMNMSYDWRFTPPADRLHVHMQNLASGADGNRRAFDATLALEREPISAPALA